MRDVYEMEASQRQADREWRDLERNEAYKTRQWLAQKELEEKDG